ncbi:MAG: citrate synthase [Bacteroidota bacterium]|nr:citrate synthase [Bacteroidota bacterium]
MDATLLFDGHEFTLPVHVGTEHEVGIDISALRRESGAITLDPGYGNTGSCTSSITFIDGEQGILRYRGYAIEDLAARSTFIEVMYLLVYGALPDPYQLSDFEERLRMHTLLHEDMKKLYEGFPPSAQPMAVLSAMVASLSTYYSDTEEDTELNIIRLLAKLKTIAAFAFKKSIGQPFVYPRNDLEFVADFLHMMFAVPSEPCEVSDVVHRALDMLLILHADHEQNCSTSTVRMVGSSGADLYSTISSGVSALSGPLHGGANMAVIEMLEAIRADGANYRKYVNRAKDRNDPFRLMGFGHRVYKNFDPRSILIKEACDRVLTQLNRQDPLLDIARNLERVALEDEYFIARGLYPNLDFYSGIVYRAIGLPTSMFTVLFALGRLPGWIAHWKEMRASGGRLHRPRQLYTGENLRSYPH